MDVPSSVLEAAVADHPSEPQDREAVAGGLGQAICEMHTTPCTTTAVLFEPTPMPAAREDDSTND